MSKSATMFTELEEQATELGFQSLYEAQTNGYVVDLQFNPTKKEWEHKLRKESKEDEAHEEAHMEWEFKKRRTINDLEMLMNDTPYKVHKEIIKNAIEFIKEGEV